MSHLSQPMPTRSYTLTPSSGAIPMHPTPLGVHSGLAVVGVGRPSQPANEGGEDACDFPSTLLGSLGDNQERPGRQRRCTRVQGVLRGDGAPSPLCSRLHHPARLSLNLPSSGQISRARTPRATFLPASTRRIRRTTLTRAATAHHAQGRRSQSLQVR